MPPCPQAATGPDRGELIDTAEVAIVGAGIAGCSLAFELARRGVETCLLDQGTVPGQGASTVPAALLNPHRGRTGRARAEDLAGLAAFWALIGQLERDGRPTGSHRGGVLRVAASPRQARLWQELEGVHVLAPQEVPAQLHAPHGAIRIAAGGWVEPLTLLATLVAAAVERGAEMRHSARVERLEGRVLHTSFGALRAARVVLCTGADATVGLPLPELRRVAGDAVRLAWSGPPLPPLAGSVNAAFHAGGVWITGGHVPMDSRNDSQHVAQAHANTRSTVGCARHDDLADAAERLRAALAWSLPAATAAPIIGHWRGVRARLTDPYPVVRTVAQGVTFYGALAGRGFLCAADLSARLADAIVRRTVT